jgi:hypothetical protein
LAGTPAGRFYSLQTELRPGAPAPGEGPVLPEKSVSHRPRAKPLKPDLKEETSVTQIRQDQCSTLDKLDAMLEEDPVNHTYRLDRAAFTDEELFELEMKHIFEGNWIYLAHESQIPKENDYSPCTWAASR